MGTKLQKIGLAVVFLLVVGFVGYRIYLAGGVGPLLDSIKQMSAATKTPLPSTKPKPSVSQPSAPSSGPQAQVLGMVNDQRRAHSLAVLSYNAALAAAAQAHANDMARRGYFAHESPEGTTFQQRIAATGYTGDATAENIGLTGDGTLQAVITNWMNSPDHRANILGAQYHAAGVGVAHGTYQGQASIFVVGIFGSE